MKLSIIIPLFNEKDTILQLLNLIEEQKTIKKQIIIINDCSSDNSLELINTYNFQSEHLIINHSKNLGKGACIKTAKKFINGDIVLIQDADLEYNPNDYNKLIEPITCGNVNVVYGSRVLGKNRYKNYHFTSLIRIFFNHALTTLSNLLNDQNLTDAHTCYKVFSKNIFNKVVLIENDFSFCPEITTKISKINEKIQEVPIEYRGRKYDEGKKIKTMDGFKAIYVLIKYNFLK